MNSEQSSYSKKLTNPLWQRRRLEIFSRDNFCCTRCGNSKLELQVHHLDYIPGIEPWEYPLDMLTTLCADCHAAENSRKKHETYLLTSLKMKGFLADDILRLSVKIDTDPFFTNYLKNFLRKNL
jgi:5-methylcytosine-specific restriction endonuclease McrA